MRANREALEESTPDTSRTIRHRYWATEEECERFQSVKGMRKRESLQTLGHPSIVWKGKDGTESWSYPWGTDWRVIIKNGVCTHIVINDGW